MKGMPNMGQLMKQAQQLQSKMAKLQDEIGDKTVDASAGGGMVTVVANGRQEILSVHVDPEVINPDDQEMLQDLILTMLLVNSRSIRHIQLILICLILVKRQLKLD